MKYIRTVVLLMGLMFLTLTAWAQEQAISGQEVRLDSIFTEWDKPGVPGAAVGIIRDGKWVHKTGYGMANLEYDIPIDAKSVFRIGSVSKQFTAACIVLLIEKGELAFDDTLHSFYPDFPDYAKDITIAQLVNHTSGLRDYLMISFFKGYGDQTHYTGADIMRWLQRQSDLNFEPGSEYLYSNSGYWLLGKIVEEVSGMNMKDFAEQELFQPLGMENTHFHNDHTHIVKNRASGYQPDAEQGFRMDMTTLDMIGDGGVYSTLEDMKKWVDEFYSREVLGESFWRLMLKKGKLNNGKEISYASGLDTGDYKGLAWVGHGGAFVGYRAELMHFPAHETSFLIMSNRRDASLAAKNNAMADIILSDYLEEEETDVSTPEIAEHSEVSLSVPLSQIEGYYWNDEYASIIELKVEEDTLRLHRGGNSYQLKLSGPDLFISPDLKVLKKARFSREENQNKLTIHLEGYSEPDVYEAYTPAQYDSAGLQAFSGSYYSPDLNETYQLKHEDGKLYLYLNHEKYAALNPVKENLFTHDRFGVLKFKETTKGTINGFELSLVRVENLKFEKQ